MTHMCTPLSQRPPFLPIIPPPEPIQKSDDQPVWRPVAFGAGTLSRAVRFSAQCTQHRPLTLAQIAVVVVV